MPYEPEKSLKKRESSKVDQTETHFLTPRGILLFL